jgi:hypothetical protein
LFSEAMTPGAAIPQGSTVLLKSQATGLFCRVVAVAGQQQISCGASHSLATRFQWDGPSLLYMVGA